MQRDGPHWALAATQEQTPRWERANAQAHALVWARVTTHRRRRRTMCARANNMTRPGETINMFKLSRLGRIPI